MPRSLTGARPRAAEVAVERVALPGAGRCAYLRELCGADEEAVSGRGTLAALRLLDRLLADGPGASLRAGGAAAATVTERDLLLAHVYCAAFGARIEATLRCAGCGEPFDLDFSLDDLVAGVVAAPGAGCAVAEGVYAAPDGRTFRLPTGEDELAVLGLAPEEAARELLRRCVVAGDPGGDEAALVEAMERAGPVLDLDLAAACPECGGEQAVRFALQDYLLATLERDGRKLAHEVHALAAAYSWGLGEILSLRRRRRQALAALVCGEPPWMRR
jgi:hypothetical protein